MTRVTRIAFGIALVVLSACASMGGGEGVPISSVSELAGHWVGTVDPGRWGPATPFQLDIAPDGRLTATWDINTAWGTISVHNGRATFEMHPLLHEGTVRLYESGGKRTLVLDDDFRPFQARVVQRK